MIIFLYPTINLIYVGKVKDKILAMIGKIESVIRPLKILYPTLHKIIFFLIFFFIYEFFILITSKSSCVMTAEGIVQECKMQTILGLPFITVSIIGFFGTYIITSIIIYLVKKLKKKKISY